MYDPFEGIEPAENQTNNSGSSDGSGVYDPFGEIEPYKPPEETSFLDKVKSFGQKVYEQADRTTTNIENALPSYIGKVEKAADAYGQEVSQAATRAYEARAGGEDINDEDPTSGYEGQNYDTAKAGLYDSAVGTPAGYVAITPFVPAPVRGAAGLLAAPTIVNGTMNAYDQNVANDDGTPVVSTAKQTLLDPVIDPVKEAVTQPGKYVQEIVDNPLNVWDKVFLPASMVEGAVKGGEKLVPDRVKGKARAKMDSAVDTMDALGRDLRGEDVSRGGSTGFDDLANSGEGVKAMRVDVYDPFGDVEPASRGGSTGFDDLSRASDDNAASYGAPPADASAPVFNVAGDADWAGMNDSTKAAANELVTRWNRAHPEAPVTMTSGKRSGDGSSHHDVGEAVDFVSDSFEGEAGRPLRDEFGRMASDMGLTPFDEYNGSGNEAYARGENFHVTVPKDWQGSGRRISDMADDGGYGFDDGMRDASDMADDSGGMYEETGDMATDVYNRYRQDGLTDAEAAGMTGNIAQESGFDTGAVSGDGHGTKALIQWDGDRYARFEKWCEDNGRDPSDWRAQVDYSVEEMKTTEPDALRRMRERGDDLTPEEAAQIIREDYERPDPAQANDAHRMDVARRVYDQGGKRQGAPLDDSSRPSGGEDGVIETGDRGGNLNFDEPAPSDRVQAMRDTSERPYEKISRGEKASSDNRAFPEKEPSRAPGIDDLDGMNEKEKFDQARAETKELNDGVEDYAGDRVRVQFEGQNKLAADKAVDAFEYGDKSPKSISEKRAAVSRMVKNTIKDPDMAIKNEQGGKTYVKTFYGQDFSEVTVKVGTDAEGNGHIVVTRKDPGRLSRNLLKDSERPTPDEIEEMNRINIPEDVRREVDARSVQRMDTIRSMRNDVDYTAHEDTGVPVTRQGIVDYVNRLFNATIRTGRTEKGARGQFDTLSHVIRTQNFAEPRVIAHELGHFLDERFHFSEAPEYAGELLHLVKDRFENGYDNLDVSGKMAEGFAEFFHDYVTDRAQARRNAPEFYNYFEKKLHQDPKLTGATNKLTKVMYQWNHQGAVARVKGHISFASDSTGFQGLKNMLKDGTFGEAGKKAWSRLYTEGVDELHPLADVVAAVEKRIGKKLPFSSNPFLNAWAARGWAGKAITLLQHGDPERGIPSLKGIFQKVGKDKLKDFSAFLVALREKDIYDFNSKLQKGEEGAALKATMDPIDAGMTIRELAKKHPEFVEAAKELYRFQQHLINELVNAGMLSAKAAADMRKRWPHYVPFQRIVDGIDAPSVGGKKFVNVGNTIQKFKGSSRDIVDPLESVISNTFRVVSAIERNKVGQSFVKLSRMKGMGDLCEEVKGTPRATDSTFYVWEGGKKKTYATSPELLSALKMTNKEGMNMLVKILRVPAGLLRAGATLSLEFIMRNPVRDMISASLYSKHGFIPVWDTVRGLSLYLKKGKEYWDYMNSGAAQSAMVSLDRDYLHGQMRDLLKKKSVLSMCANPIEALRAFSEATEMATRLAEFDLAKKGYTGIGNRLFGKERKPLSNTEAGIEARDVTLDFGRHGKSTQSLNQTIAFFNAAIQGTDKMIREFKEHPAQMTAKTFIGITLPSVLLWYLNKDDPRYQELPQWQKDIFWVIPGKDTLYKIPKPFELGILFGTVPERVMQYMYDKEKGRNGPGFKGLGGSIMDNLLPSAIPTGMLPALEWISNYSFFMGRNIVPLSQSKLPDRQQYGPYTSYLARKVGNAFNLSPRKIDNTIQDVGGNLAALGNSLIDQAAGLAETRPAKRASEMPGVRGFTATPYASSDSVQRLRDDFSQQEKLYNEFKMTKQKPEGYDAAKYMKYKAAMDAMNNTYRAERKIMDSKQLDSRQKRERLDRIKMQQTNIARRALGLSKVSNE
ncbi:phage tail tip lysozyme [uncultured Dialister sp.]|uniref:phage tail tip lysozyme n=1 Tax=uncultured Dialister sp. TaxID=278064 RepID=UPI00266EB0AD|nr:phage tail tip lysozyme [uncultured Dialister sp.]